MSLCHETALMYCYETLHHELEITKNPTRPAPDPSLTQLPGNLPLFITIYTHGSQKRLRGCIGTFGPKFDNFAVCLQKYVHQAAFCDTRFAPLSAQELQSQDVTLSLNVLHSFENASRWDDWEIGTHGTTIYFEDASGRTRNATFLPSVAKDHGFSKEKAVDQLRKKAGGNAKYQGQEFYEHVRVERYQSSARDLTYEEFLKRSNAAN